MGANSSNIAIESIIKQRIEGIKLKKPDAIKEVIDVENYSKFDDWPPGVRLKGEAALKIEKDALKVLEEYRYTMGDLAVNIRGDVAWASFYLQYDGMIRKKSFGLKSRVSMILAKSGPQWKIVHEHFSVLPVEVPTLSPKPVQIEAKVLEEPRDELEEAVLKVLEDGVERNAAEISKEITEIIGQDVSTSKIVETCRALTSKGFIDAQGRFYPKYKIKRRPT